MANLKQKNIGGKSIVLKPVPARDARKMQMHLAALLAEPLAKALPQEATGEPKDQLGKVAKGITLGATAFAGLFAKLNDGDADKLIDSAAPFILVDGSTLDENKHFTADTLFDLYEALWFFYSETFGSFLNASRSRLDPSGKWTSILSKVPTSTGFSGGPA